MNTFDPYPDTNSNGPRREVALRAAAFIADHGLSYREARQKAVIELFGIKAPRDCQPDQAELEAALLEHLELFDGEEHPRRVEQLRLACTKLVRKLNQAGFNSDSILITGAAWKGIVTEHAHGHLQIFSDDPKEAHINLLNIGLGEETAEVPHFSKPNHTIVAISCEFDGWPFQISLYDRDDIRGAMRVAVDGKPERGNLEQLQKLDPR